MAESKVVSKNSKWYVRKYLTEQNWDKLRLQILVNMEKRKIKDIILIER